MLHESAFHTALKVLDLIVPTSFGDELMFNDALRIFFSLVVALVEVIEGKRTSVGGFGHYNYL